MSIPTYGTHPEETASFVFSDFTSLYCNLSNHSLRDIGQYPRAVTLLETNSSNRCANSWIRTNNLLKTYVSIFWRDKFSLSSQGEQWVLCPVELYSLTYFINKLCFKMDSNHHSTFFKHPTLEYRSDSNREPDRYLCVYLCAIEAKLRR